MVQDEGEVAGTTTESDEEFTTGGVMADEHVTTAQGNFDYVSV